MKNLSLFLILVNLALPTLLCAQVSFAKRYGTNSKSLEILAAAVSTTPDGALLLGGYTESGAQGAYDFFVQKLNPDGTEAWLKTFGGADLDILTDLTPATGGGYLFSGYAVDTDDNSFDAVLGKINDNGDLLWWKTYGTAGTEAGLTLCQRTDGSIILLGFTLDANHQPAFFRAAFDQNGGFVTDFLTTVSDDIAEMKVMPTSDGGYLAEISGGNIIFGEPDAILKYGSNHALQWTTSPTAIGGQIFQSVNEIFDIEATSTGILIAFSSNNGPNTATNLVRLNNATGSVNWLRKVQIGYADKANVHAFTDGTLGVAVLSSNLLIKKLSAAGATVDSVTVNPPLISGFFPDFTFPDQDHLYLFGNAGSFDQDDYAVARFNLTPLPNLDWQQTFGETGVPDREIGYAVASLPDNGFVMGGSKENPDGDMDIWLVKADAQGTILWEKTYSVSQGSFDSEKVGSVELDAAGNIIVFAVTDESDPEYHLLKFTPTGDLVFDKAVFTADYAPDFFHAIPMPDGGAAACVAQDVFTANTVPKIIRFNSAGNILWTKSYSGDVVHDLEVLPDGTLAAAGYTDGQPWMFKTDANGNILWEKTFAVAGFGTFNSIRVSADGNLFAAGVSSNVTESEYHALVIKTNGLGEQIWKSEFSKGDGSYWVANVVLPDANGGACFTGIFLAPPANPDLFSSIFRYRLNISQVDASGNLVSEQRFGTDGSYPYGTSADRCPDGDVVVCATLNSGTALEDAWVVKSDCTMGVSVKGPKLEGTFELSPNPSSVGGYMSLLLHFSAAKTLKVECFDGAGKKCWERAEQVSIDKSRLELPVPNASGIYLLKITDENGASQTVRVVAQ